MCECPRERISHHSIDQSYIHPPSSSVSAMSPTASHRMLPSTTETVQTKPFPIRGRCRSFVYSFIFHCFIHSINDIVLFLNFETNFIINGGNIRIDFAKWDNCQWTICLFMCFIYWIGKYFLFCFIWINFFLFWFDWAWHKFWGL